MAGYQGYRMSNNAVAAYEAGERPLTKWTKQELVELLNEEVQPLAKQLNLKELRLASLSYSGWHHTSSRYNKTNFYSFDQTANDRITKEYVESVISMREPKQPKNQATYITALASYTVWNGTRKRPKATNYDEIIRFKSDQKMVHPLHSDHPMRLSSISIVFQVETKTKFISDDFFKRKFKSKNKFKYNFYFKN